MAQPTTPAFGAVQARRFRKAFRALCDHYGARQEDIGKALDTYGLRSGTGGQRSVANAMLRSRRLTHRMGRRLVVGLFLSAPVRKSWKHGRRSERDHDRAVYEEAYGLLVELGAIQLDRSERPPVYCPPQAVKAFADELSIALSDIPGIGRRNFAAINRAAQQWLRKETPSMARACVDCALEMLPATVSRNLSREARFLERLFESAFGEDYIFASAAAPEPREFVLLHKQRPELSEQYFQVPLRSSL